MTLKLKSGGRGVSIPAGIAIGIGISLVLTIIGAALMAYLIIGESIAEGAMGFGSKIILTASAAVGAFTAAGLIRQKRVMVCGVTGAGYYLSLLVITILCFGGEFAEIGISALMVLLGVGVSMLPMLRKKRSGRKYKIPAYR